jgi:acyl dehydratase
MPIPAHLAGSVTEPIEHEVDARWLMAYAAGIGDHNPRYLDTLRPGGIVGHPLFPVCVEWPAVLAARDLAAAAGAPIAELRRGVHANHDLHVHRLVRAGDRLATTATITGVEHRSPGAYLQLRLDTVDQAGEPVATTWQGSLYLGVATEGEDRWTDRPPAHPGAPSDHVGESPREEPVAIAAGAAHVYTECARIWNPIHTDPDAARRAGLERIILHGTATHALGLTRVVDHYAGGDPGLVRRALGRFGGMVEMPSVVGVVTRRLAPDLVELGVLNTAGQPAVRDGLVVLDA